MLFCSSKSMTKSLSMMWTVALFVCGTSVAAISLNDIEGVWKGTVYSQVLNILTDKGSVLFCRDKLPPNCREELPPGTEKYTISESTLTTEFTFLTGISTKEESAKVTPTCAKLGYYPVDSYFEVYHDKIEAFDVDTGRIVFKSNNTDSGAHCQVFKHHFKKDGELFVTVQHLIRYAGSPEHLEETGDMPYACKKPPRTCMIRTTPDGMLYFHFHDIFNLTCVSGHCLETLLPRGRIDSTAYIK